MAGSPHPRETNLTGLGAGQLNLYFIDVTNVWKSPPPARDVKGIRKVLIHHHAGFPHDLTVKHATQKALSGEAMPNKYVDIASGPDFQTKAYGYHYDVPFVEELSPDGKKLVVYVTNLPGQNSPHTGAGQNEAGIGVSLIGTMRAAEENPDGLNFGAKLTPPAEYTAAEGLPSKNQRRILPVLVRYLQEQYGIDDSYVQAHFQHSKPTCPGYDTERWVLEHEETRRHNGTSFCYPIALSGSAVPFLGTPAKESTRAAAYIRNTRAGKSGFYPFGRRGFWHNGAHLFPPTAGAPVYCVHAGWVLAARYEKSIEVDGVKYGSGAFVLVQHEDPGIWDQSGSIFDNTPIFRWNSATQQWVPGTVQIPLHPTYYSLYMHLGPLSESVGWVATLKRKDPAAFAAMMKDKAKVVHFKDVSIPVAPGEVLGSVGSFDPFAAMDKKAAVQDADVYSAAHTAVLHFEMFSVTNLVSRLESAGVAKAWTITDANDNALAEAVAAKLKGASGLKDAAKLLDDRLSDMDTADPRNEDPSRMAGAMSDDLLEPLSRIIGAHANEWRADWKSVLSGWYREWGLAKNKIKDDDKRIKGTVEHHLKVIKELQWDRALTDYRNRPLAGETETYPCYYHPIRFLNWLNGLERTPDVPNLPYNTFAGVTPFDVAPRNLNTVAAAGKGDRSVTIAVNTGNPVINGVQKLVGTRLAFPPSRTIYTIQTVTEEKSKLTLTLNPPLEQDIKKGAKIRVGGNGWRWTATLPWETNLVGPPPVAPAPTPGKTGATP